MRLIQNILQSGDQTGKTILKITFLLLFIYVNPACTSSDENESINNPSAFSGYIAGYTAGVISVESPIEVRFVHELADSTQIGQEVNASLFSITPEIRGKTIWTDRQTLEFIPDKPLNYGTRYQIKLAMDPLIEMPEELSAFTFSVLTMRQNFSIDVTGFSPVNSNNLSVQQINGLLLTADIANPEKVEKVLLAVQQGNPLPIAWAHSPDKKTHRFTIQDVKRGNSPNVVKLVASGETLQVDKKYDQDIEIPALGDFKLMRSEVIQSPEQFLELQFSDPLADNQDLNGLIHMADEEDDFRFVIDGTRVRIFPASRLAGTKTIHIEPGIKNIEDFKFKVRASVDVSFEQLKPDIRLIGKGVIVPSTNGLVMPFETVNLEAVDVTIIKIYESNLSQFFQVNQYDGNNESQRVGRPVAQKTLSLEAAGVADLGKWNRFTLDLSELIKDEPGAVYQARISFKKNYSVFECGKENSDEAIDFQNEVLPNADNWDNPYGYHDGYYPENYRWEDRDDPCTVSYYTPDKAVIRNVFSSDLGMIVKQGKNGEVFIAVNDIKTTDPMAGVEVGLYDLQKKLIGKTTTDAQGWAKLTAEKKPFLLVATKNNQKGYLKLDDGSSLSLSNFDVAGQEVQEGLKGFMYGERGVWRPGDSLYISFMLEDKNKILPPAHPVIFELEDPQGNVAQKMVRNNATGGFYSFPTATANNAPTGNWMAKVKVGGATFNKRIKIETIKPNRLKIKLDFGTDKFTATDRNTNGQLAVQWLTGATARNLRATFELLLSKGTTSFEQFKNYVFEDKLRDFSSETTAIFDSKINEQGFAQIGLNLPAESEAPGVLNATFIGKVYEEGGNFSIDQFSIPYYPYASFVGVKLPTTSAPYEPLETGKSHTVEVVVTSPEGESIDRSEINMELYKLDWRWWWDQTGNTSSNYMGNAYGKPIEKEKIRAENGKGTWRFKVDQPEWGRFYVRACDPVSGHCAGDIVYIDWPGYAGRGGRDGATGASMLSFSSDKNTYQVGEQAVIHMPGSLTGKALVSIENGSSIIQTFWINTKAGETTFPFEITKEMAPNIFVHVSLLQPHDQTTNDLPIRMYGVIPVLVDNPDTHLHPEIKMPDILAPEQKITITVSEKEGKPMAYTLAVVDEGLLDITRFKTPSPWEDFYAREALGVKTWDLYDYVVGAYGGELERILSVGGDGELTNRGERKANRFTPVVKFIGPFMLNKNQQQKHTITMPRYVGSVRTMVIAGFQGAYGKAEQTTPVRQPLMILGTLPRVLGPEEEVTLPVDVFAMENSVKNVKVNVNTNNLITVSEAQQKNVTFTQPGDQLVDFNLKVAPTVGIGKVDITAISGGEKAGYEVEIDIRNPNPPVVDVLQTIIQPGESWNVNYEPVGLPGTNKATLEVSGIPPINLEKRLRFLTNYPHGCIEQTVSAAFPQLFLDNILEMKSNDKERVEDNVKAAISRMRTFVTSEGGFSYWPSSDDTDEWGTCYAGHFLLEAQKKGYSVPVSLLNSWKLYQQSRASRWMNESLYQKDDLIQAYRLYTLALANAADQGAMNRMKEQRNLSLQAKWQLGAAYVLLGQPEAAKTITRSLSANVKPYQEMAYTYGSALRDEAMILETLVLMNEKPEGLDLMKKISESLSNENEWMSTQTAAFCLMAVSRFIGDDPQDQYLNFDLSANNKDENVQSRLPVVRRKVNEQGGSLKINNRGKGVMYARLIQEGVPLVNDQSAVEQGLRMNILYKGINNEPVSPEALVQGTDFVAEVTVFNPGTRGNYQQLALTQIFPSGWEIINTRLNDLDQYVVQDIPEYQDIRDDRVYTYFDLSANERKTFRVILNASYAGKFYLPTITCEAMYDHTVNARKPGQWIQVVTP